MDLQAADALGRALLAEHPVLIEQGWTFGFDNATSRLGVCNYRTRRISTSRHFTAHATEAMVRDTILHEIAHALTPGAKHAIRWKVMAQRLGATPKSCAHNPYQTSDGVVAARLAEVEGKQFYRVTGSGKYSEKRYRIVKENKKSFSLVDEEGQPLRAAKEFVYLEGEAPPTAAEARASRRKANLDAVRGRAVVRVEHSAYRGKTYSVLQPAKGRTRALLVDLATGETLRCPQSLVRPATLAERLEKLQPSS